MREVLSVLLVGVSVLTGSVFAADAPGGESPQAVVERISSAAERGDFADLAACMDPDSRAEMAEGLVMATTMMIAFAGFGGAMAGEMAEGMAEAFDEEGAEIDAEAEAAQDAAAAEVEALTQSYRQVLAKHGLEKMMDEDPSGEEDFASLLAGVDQAALIGDLMVFMQSFPGAEDSGDSPTPLASDVTDYEIHGDHATARSPEGPMEFVKIDGRWFLKANAAEGEGEPSGDG